MTLSPNNTYTTQNTDILNLKSFKKLNLVNKQSKPSKPQVSKLTFQIHQKSLPSKFLSSKQKLSNILDQIFASQLPFFQIGTTTPFSSKLNHAESRKEKVIQRKAQAKKGATTSDPLRLLSHILIRKRTVKEPHNPKPQ